MLYLESRNARISPPKTFVRYAKRVSPPSVQSKSGQYRVRVNVAMAFVCIVSLLGCGSHLPKRFVTESRIDGWSYRRYQEVLDIEFPLPSSAAVGHTATYIHRDKKRLTNPEVSVATAFVTVYDQPKTLASTVRSQLQSLVSYRVRVKKTHGQHVWRIENDEQLWVLWISGRAVVKLGAPRGSERVPKPLLVHYLELYPSDLDRHGRAHKGAPSAGEAAQPGPESATPTPPPSPSP